MGASFIADLSSSIVEDVIMSGQLFKPRASEGCTCWKNIRGNSNYLG